MKFNYLDVKHFVLSYCILTTHCSLQAQGSIPASALMERKVEYI